jgi:hypothetical protein
VGMPHELNDRGAVRRLAHAAVLVGVEKDGLLAPGPVRVAFVLDCYDSVVVVRLDV